MNIVFEEVFVTSMLSLGTFFIFLIFKFLWKLYICHKSISIDNIALILCL